MEELGVSGVSDKFLEIRDLAKNYGIVRALKGVSFTVAKGEVHALLGENGAGKSTLIKIISGEETPSGGSLFINGAEVKDFNPAHAMAAGIAMVHQELAIFENMSVSDNIFPNSIFLSAGGFISRRKTDREAKELIDLFGIAISPRQKMDSLTMGQQQMVEILRCISAGKEIILLDEPTSGLNQEEVKKLMEIIRQIKGRGITVVYISHRIDEIKEISDRVTVLRDGAYVGTYENNSALTEMDLISRMVGRELSGTLYSARTEDGIATGEVVLEVKNFFKKNSVRDISFTLHKGEVLGFFGLEGSGTNTVSRMIYGLEAADGGEFFLKGKPVAPLSPDVLVPAGVMYLNNNRKNAGLLLNSPAVDNLSVPLLNQLSDGIFVNRFKMKTHAEKYIGEFNIVIPSVYQQPRYLSGGNQQKLMFSICMGSNPEIIIINEPTRGIDVGAKVEIHRFILSLIKKGLSVIVFSSELPELISLCDRVIVMAKNRICSEVAKGGGMTQQQIMIRAAGAAVQEGVK
ncbi:MAG: sugar ABC transporter ATP-binding protein, partial [Treponema sp.]|jgi:ABC-type sugar transport system ATPase subunit|nr:sugar ABC transporter ATP-binding protein [Treponema sp.]